jgi:hypothetical protein
MAKMDQREPALLLPQDSTPLDQPGRPERFVLCLNGRLCRTPFPVDLGRLDVLGREIALGAARSEAAVTSEQIDLAGSIWNTGLEADVIAHAGNVVAAQTEATLAALQDARDKHDFETMSKLAQVLLEVVDAVVGLY